MLREKSMILSNIDLLEDRRDFFFQGKKARKSPLLCKKLFRYRYPCHRQSESLSYENHLFHANVDKLLQEDHSLYGAESSRI
mmetsp:Transcript_24185/g.37704  ORF Transcript_24185/g.37704 Transcript_24185/m.37704 type:complete len:82 (+) Transcript_24185:187-432(+)